MSLIVVFESVEKSSLLTRLKLTRGRDNIDKFFSRSRKSLFFLKRLSFISSKFQQSFGLVIGMIAPTWSLNTSHNFYLLFKFLNSFDIIDYGVHLYLKSLNLFFQLGIFNFQILIFVNFFYDMNVIK